MLSIFITVVCLSVHASATNCLNITKPLSEVWFKNLTGDIKVLSYTTFGSNICIKGGDVFSSSSGDVYNSIRERFIDWDTIHEVYAAGANRDTIKGDPISWNQFLVNIGTSPDDVRQTTRKFGPIRYFSEACNEYEDFGSFFCLWEIMKLKWYNGDLRAWLAQHFNFFLLTQSYLADARTITSIMSADVQSGPGIVCGEVLFYVKYNEHNWFVSLFLPYRRRGGKGGPCDTSVKKFEIMNFVRKANEDENSTFTIGYHKSLWNRSIWRGDVSVAMNIASKLINHN